MTKPGQTPCKKGSKGKEREIGPSQTLDSKNGQNKPVRCRAWKSSTKTDILRNSQPIRQKGKGKENNIQEYYPKDQNPPEHHHPPSPNNINKRRGLPPDPDTPVSSWPVPG
ncbi:hypothetical protein MGYG_08883 [Nannizzia gypsea CBS 118893]|uniref:Uncharacterized protein n=1 Tax=Arthroderma gypseum (strain ATCC MYA-4604 / CBS 118893) TaxID=535722 RepID=E5R379_ARTGP|nr:hypothetical protein MGYG_08883 [Nannizzia gypsea CBS 118893]EFQ97108.1 hypothetical protein MGYG_08883 [Nannizzia gypsea CBS 118893]